MSTRVRNIIEWFENHKVFSIIIFLGIFFFLMVQFLNGINDVKDSLSMDCGDITKGIQDRKKVVRDILSSNWTKEKLLIIDHEIKSVFSVLSEEDACKSIVEAELLDIKVYLMTALYEQVGHWRNNEISAKENVFNLAQLIINNFKDTEFLTTEESNLIKNTISLVI